MAEAIEGANPIGARTFPIAFTVTSQRTAAAVPRGGYFLYATQDCWVKLGDNTAVAAAVATTLTPPVAANDTIRVRAGLIYPLTVPDAKYLAVIRDTADGVLDINGPMQTPG